MGEPRYVVGIDLGTTNTVVAYGDAAGGPVHDLPIPQTVAPHEVASHAQLPSAIYLAARDELPAAAARLPWDEAPKQAVFVGSFARAQGQKVPGRVVVSAKSWLCVPAVERTAAILPWAAADDVERLSPVDAEARVLSHVARAFESATGASLSEQDLTLTVPASFDEVARELTVAAATRAGLGQARLLEEPQAALYAFLRAHERSLVDDLARVRLVLVVDVGGGTTDLTLVAVGLPERAGEPPRLERIAVGDHLMLGGDNMDITLARHVERALTGTVGGLDATTWGALVESARAAKETLLGDAPPDDTPVALAQRGSKLVGGTRTTRLARADAEALLLDGFFPKNAATDVARRGARTALTELGLPFEKEPAITRHVAAFLRRHAEAAQTAGARLVDGMAAPDAVLLNGGVFKSPQVRARLLDTLASWLGSAVPLLGGVLHGDALDLAVARGAAQYGQVRRGKGLRIGGGSPRAYFVGVGDEAGQPRALCVVPKGLHEGERIEVDRTFRLVLDRPVGFPLYTSTSSSARPGQVVEVGPELERLPPLSTVLQSESEAPVRVAAFFSELGTLDLSLQMTPEALRRFSLSFSTRAQGEETQGGGGAPPPGPARAEGLHRRLEEARELILQFYGSKSKGVDPKRVKDLRRDLEKMLGERDRWSTGLNRELCGTLLGGAKNRRRSADHERVFFQLVGFTLRPGVGAPFDDWRVEQLWPLWKEGVQYTAEKPTWASWWILWRRVAAGLSAERQRELGAYLKPWLLEQGTGKKGEGPTPHGSDEMIRLACALERLGAADKTELGAFVLKKLGRGGVTSWWPLGRLGARHLLAGSAHDVVPASVAAEWAEKVLNADLKSAEGAVFALAQLGRVTGDRTRDLDESLRRRMAERLEKAGAAAHLVQAVRERVEWTSDDEAQAFGEALPPGLRL